MSRPMLMLILAIQIAFLAGLLALDRAFEQTDDCRWMAYFNPPEPPVSQLEGLSP